MASSVPHVASARVDDRRRGGDAAERHEAAPRDRRHDFVGAVTRLEQLDLLYVVRLQRLVAHLEPDDPVRVGFHVQQIDVALGEERRDAVRERLGLERRNTRTVGVDRRARAEDGDGEHGYGDGRDEAGDRRVDQRASRIHLALERLDADDAVERNAPDGRTVEGGAEANAVADDLPVPDHRAPAKEHRGTVAEVRLDRRLHKALGAGDLQGVGPVGRRDHAGDDDERRQRHSGEESAAQVDSHPCLLEGQR